MHTYMHYSCMCTTVHTYNTVQYSNCLFNKTKVNTLQLNFIYIHASFMHIHCN